MNIGDLVYYSNKPLAAFMKVIDSPKLWKLGILIEHNSDGKYIILAENGVQECPIRLIRPFPPLPRLLSL